MTVGLTACGGGDTPPETTETATTAEAPASPGQMIFERTCFACHSIGEGPRIGPDLEDVHTRRERDWLVTPTGKFNVYNTAHDVY